MALTYGAFNHLFDKMPSRILGYSIFKHESDAIPYIKSYFRSSNYLVFGVSQGWHGATPDLIIRENKDKPATLVECELLSSNYLLHNHPDELVDVVYCIEDNLAYFNNRLPKETYTFDKTFVAPGEARHGMIWIAFNFICIPRDKWQAQKLRDNKERVDELINTTEKGIVAKFLVELCLQDKTRDYFRSERNRKKEENKLRKRLGEIRSEQIQRQAIEILR